MKCLQCDKDMVETVEDYDYSSVLPGIVLHGITVARCPCGEDELEIPRIDQLHRQIAFAVATKESRLTPAELRFLRKYLGLSGVDFARRVTVGATQLSRWENGKETMSEMAERLVRLMVLTEAPRDSYTLDFFDRIEGAPQPTRIELTNKGRQGWQPTASLP